MRTNALVGVLTLLVAGPVLAQRGAPAPGRVGLPWQVADLNGNQWVVQQQGTLRQQGNMPLYAQAAVLTVNGSGLTGAVAQGSLDPKSGELVLTGFNVRNVVSVTRRIHINRQESYARYIDMFRNTSGKDQVIAVQYMSNFNYQPTGVQFVEDPRSRERMLGAAITLEIGRSMYEVYSGKGAKASPQLMSQPNSNQVQATMQLSIPANKEVSLVHLHGITNGPEQPNVTILAMRDSRMLADVPIEVRKTIINSAPVSSVGDREILRGDLLDVIELRDGDQLKGTLTESSYKLAAFYGPMELPADRVVGVINVGQFRPRQLVVTVDGEVFGGTLGKETIGIQLSSGQTVQVPLGQVARLGYRKRAGEAEEWVMNKPLLSLRSGERLFIEMPTAPIDVMTRFGALKVPPGALAGVVFDSEEHGIHEIRLNDGSHFGGLVASESFDIQLAGSVAQKRLTIPAAMMERIRLTADEPETPESAAVLRLTGGDEFVGTLAGQQQLDTRFDTIALNGAELRSLTRDREAGLDVQVVLWDQTTVGGQLREPLLECTLASGLTIKVPLGVVESYSNPQPQASDGMVTRIKAIVDDLSAQDWKKREQAEAQLVALGPSIIGVLRQMSGKVPAEAQQRIDAILIQLRAAQEPIPISGTPVAPIPR